MALSETVSRRIGEQIINWLYLGIRTGARRAVENYRDVMAEAATFPAGAERDEMEASAVKSLKRAVDLPHRARARIEYALSQLPGTQAEKIAKMNASLALYDPEITVADLNAEITTMENFCQGLVDDFKVGTKTYDDIASAIEAQFEKEADRWVLPLPPGYQDIWEINGVGSG